MKRPAVIVLLLILSLPLKGEGIRRVSYSLEWGFSPALYSSVHANYICSLGYRVNESEKGFAFSPNAFCLAGIGFNPGEKLNISIYSGGRGVKEERVFPIILGVSYFAGGMNDDGIFLRLCAGVAVHSFQQGLAKTASIGPGYRLKLTGKMSLNAFFSIDGMVDKPEVIDKDSGEVIPERDVRSSGSTILGASVGIGISF